MFTIEIETGNAAFGVDDEARNAEVARILRAIARLLIRDRTDGACRDANGNRVGYYGFDIGPIR